MNSLQVLSCSVTGLLCLIAFFKSLNFVSSLSQQFSKPAMLQKHISVQPLQGTVTQITKADEPLTLAMAKPFH